MDQPEQLNAKRKHQRRHVIAIIIGVIVSCWCGIGSAFVWGAIQQGNRSVDRSGFAILIVGICAGIAAIMFGIRGSR
jgi:hypothetical protein